MLRRIALVALLAGVFIPTAAVATPIADFTWSPSSPQAGQVVQFTDTSTGSPTSWSWNFGDGGTSTLQNPTHVFAAGSFSVGLSVSNNGGASAPFITKTVSTAPAATVANFTWSPSSPQAGEVVQFTDTSTGSPTSWSWNFGDGGTSTLQNPTHVFAAGSFSVGLSVSNNGGASAPFITKTVSTAPAATVANFTWSPSSPQAGEVVQFTDTSTGSPTSWSWNFGDGGTSTLQNPTHVFAAGSFSVGLSVSNNGGASAAFITKTVSTAPAAAVANFTWSPSSPQPGQVVQFTDTSTGSPTSWSWNFGDGGTSTLQNPTHTFAAGSFSVGLSVSNNGGATTTFINKTVSTAPSPPVANFTWSQPEAK